MTATPSIWAALMSVSPWRKISGLTVIPFLTQNYKQIHYYDARYFNKTIAGGSVADMIAKYNIHDVYVIIADFHSFSSGFLINDVNYHLGLY